MQRTGPLRATKSLVLVGQAQCRGAPTHLGVRECQRCFVQAKALQVSGLWAAARGIPCGQQSRRVTGQSAAPEPGMGHLSGAQCAFNHLGGDAHAGHALVKASVIRQQGTGLRRHVGRGKRSLGHLSSPFDGDEGTHPSGTRHQPDARACPLVMCFISFCVTDSKEFHIV